MTAVRAHFPTYGAEASAIGIPAPPPLSGHRARTRWLAEAVRPDRKNAVDQLGVARPAQRQLLFYVEQVRPSRPMVQRVAAGPANRVRAPRDGHRFSPLAQAATSCRRLEAFR